MFDVEHFWEALLSREPELIRSTYEMLPEDEKMAVYAHLREMAQGEGWSEPQRLSAQTALEVIDTAA